MFVQCLLTSSIWGDALNFHLQLMQRCISTRCFFLTGVYLFREHLALANAGFHLMLPSANCAWVHRNIIHVAGEFCTCILTLLYHLGHADHWALGLNALDLESHFEVIFFFKAERSRFYDTLEKSCTVKGIVVALNFVVSLQKPYAWF